MDTLEPYDNTREKVTSLERKTRSDEYDAEDVTDQHSSIFFQSLQHMEKSSVPKKLHFFLPYMKKLSSIIKICIEIKRKLIYP